MGACAPVHYDFKTEAEERVQEQWTPDCFACQAAVKDIEERIHLTRGLTDEGAARTVAGTCDRLHLPTEYDKYCRNLISGPRIEEIAWMAKVHYEILQKKELGTSRFSDKVCEEVMNEEKGGRFCEKWIDPAELKRKTLEESIEAVFY